MGVLIGLDLGSKRVGVAVTDANQTMALPLATLECRGRKHLAQELKKIIDRYQAEIMVVGLPKTLKGDIGIAAEKIMAEAEALKSAVGIPCVYWDERLSSQEVERLLQSEEVRPARRREVRDQLAAQRILQNYLDATRIRQAGDSRGVE